LKQKYTREQYDTALKLHQEGKTIYRISKIMDINKGTVYDWCKRNIKPMSVWTHDDFDEWNSHRWTPERITVFSSRRTGEGNPAWKGDGVNEDSARARARRKFKAPKGKERHHIDGNSKNNEDSNVMFLTRKEHMILDGRIKNLKQFQ
jgi:hypothetical protein